MSLMKLNKVTRDALLIYLYFNKRFDIHTDSIKF